MIKRLLLLTGLTAILAVTSCGGGGGAYTPGNLAKDEAALNPPEQKGVEMGYWKVEEDIRLYHFSDGMGRAVLVVHGGPGIPAAEPWKGLNLLSDKYRFVYYDQRGCGKSTRPVDKFSSPNFYQNMMELESKLGLSTQIADMERIRRLLGEEKLILIGHSFGGFLSLLYALEFPQRVEKLVLIAPAGVLQTPKSGEGMDVLREYLSEERQKDYDEFLTRYFNFGKLFEQTEAGLAKMNMEYGSFYMEAMERKTGKTLTGAGFVPAAGGWMVQAMYMSMGRKYDFRPYIKKTGIPVLVIHGGQDLMASSVSEEYASLLSGKLEIISNATHFPFDETPQEFARAVSGFLAP